MRNNIERQCYVAQRLTAMLLAPLVLVHMALIFIAVQDGLTAEEILSRTRGNMLWALFYSVFVITAAIHAPIGVRNVLREWTRLSPSSINILSLVLFVLLLAAGMRAVVAVY
jgi:fumarate reductase subunit C